MKKIVFIIIFPLLSFSQVQIGSDINGEAILDFSGSSVSISSNGDIVAIGATYNDGGGVDSGHVRVYQNISGIWTQIGTDINGEAISDNSGWNISLSGDGLTIAIGAPYNDGNGTTSGHVRIYKNISGTWTQIGGDINGEAANNQSGWSISLSDNGSILAVGAPSNNAIGNASGHVRVYQNVSGTWTQIGLDIDGDSELDRCGWGVSISGDGTTLAVGVPYGNINESGYVRVYKNLLGTWTQIGNTINGEASEDHSGSSVTLSNDGTYIAIAADSNDGNGIDSGHVRVYRNISGNWIQVGTDINGEAVEDYSGSSISLSDNGNVLAVSSIFNNGNGIYSGSVRVYQNILEIWTQISVDINGEAALDNSGSSISLSADGTKLAIGAPYNDGNGNNSGHVRVYDLTTILNSNTFVLSNFTIYPNPTSNILNINLQETLLFEKAIIYTTSGQIIKTTTTQNINVNDLSSGTYFIDVVTDKGKATKSFIKE